MKQRSHPARRAACLALALAVAFPAVRAASPAASSCPDYFYPNGSPPINLAVNPSFETAQPGVVVGQPKCWQSGDPIAPTSAAAGWKMHSSNQSATVCSRLVPSDPHIGPTGKLMLAFKAGGNEGGIYQEHRLDPAKAYMFSVWVKVLSGQVAIQSRSYIGGPVSSSSKIGEWEQLRVCTNSLANTDNLIVYNQAAAGGVFLADRAELVEIPIRE